MSIARRRLAAARVLAVLLVATGFMTAHSGPAVAAGSPSMTVSPQYGLAEGDAIHVSATGLTPGQRLSLSRLHESVHGGGALMMTGTDGRFDWTAGSDGRVEIDSRIVSTTEYPCETVYLSTGELADRCFVVLTSASEVARVPITIAGQVRTNHPPVVPLTVTPTSGLAPLTVSADATGTTDADGHVAFIDLHFGGNNHFPGPTASFTYTSPGTYTVTATAGDDYEFTRTTASVVVSVPNRAPVAQSTAVALPEDSSASAVVLGATDPDGDAIAYAVTSAPVHGTLGGAAPNLTYTPAPDYFGPDSIVFKATDPAGLSSSATVSIQVTPVNDVPQLFGVSTTGAAEGRAAHLIFYAFDPDKQAASDFAFTVTFGDGQKTTGKLFAVSDDVYGVDVGHPYNRYGTYTLSITVNDKAGGSAAGSASLQVTDAPLSLAPMSGGKAVANVPWPPNLRIECVGDSNPAGVATDLTAVAQWGDGTSSTLTVQKNNVGCAGWSFSITGTHTWKKKGTYTVTVTVTSAGGAKATAKQSVPVAGV
jgi:PKD repeat protein